MATASAVAVHGVHKRFGDTVALRGVDLEIAPGALVAVLGPNGAGKSTLIDLVTGLRAPDSGDVSIFGRSPREKVARERLGVTLQEPEFPDGLRVDEILRFVAAHRPSRPDIDGVLTQYGLAKLRRRRANALSGGQRRRLAVAATFIGGPELVLLDEPSAGIDVTSRTDLWEGVRGAVDAGAAVLLTTHYLEEAEALADRLVLLGDGQVVAEGSPQQIREQVPLEKLRVRTEHPLPAVDAASARQVAGTWELCVTDAAAIHSQLIDGGVDPRAISAAELSLEEAFVVLTAGGDRP